jgi:2-amino-4-hydroxy-6-hydroxymethyldihydropteridine diphosphokinase
MIQAVTSTVPDRERVFIALGSNLGDRAANLTQALHEVGELPETTIVRVSYFMETEPWGEMNQPAFLNAVAEIRTQLQPEALLTELKRIETDLGRVPSYRWGPRLIDLDLLLYGDRRLQTERLTLPHPGILERSFVFEPLGEIAPDILGDLRGELRRAAVPV